MFESLIKIWAKFYYVFLQGLWGTVWLSLLTLGGGCVAGVVIALVRMSKIKPIRFIASAYIEVIRGTPILLQLYFFWIGVPKLVPFTLSDTTWVIIALIVNSSAYVAEVIRAGIQGVDSGQKEAAKSLGLTDGHTMRYIILPQAVKNILPALGNEFIVMVKETSLASVFFVGELMTSYKTVQAQTFLTIPSLIIVGIIYFILNYGMSRLVKILEKRLQESD